MQTKPSTSTPLKMNCSQYLLSWLQESNISLAFTTYQTNRLFTIGRKPDGELSTFERMFDRPMGLYRDGNRLIMTARHQLWYLDNVLAPGQVHHGSYDKLYVPRRSFTTGDVNAHDVAVDENGDIIFVNTEFSCLAKASNDYSFEPIWQPPFISDINREDRCHLNGLAMLDGKPAYVTACSRSDIAAGWRSRRVDGGVVVEVSSREIVATGLSMPHSPRWYGDKLWLLNSGSGELGYLDDGKFQAVTFCPGFVRGLAFYGDMAVVGISKPRNKHFQGLPLDELLAAKDADAICGLYVINLTTGKLTHWLELDGVVKELFDVVVLPETKQPMSLGFKTDEIDQLVTYPGGIILPGVSKEPATKNTPASPPPSGGKSLPLKNRPNPTPGKLAGKKPPNREKLQAAADRFKEILQRQPNNIQAYNGLGNVLQVMGEIELAKSCYERILKINPKVAIARSNLGAIWQLKGENNQAIAAYEEAIRLDPKLPVAHENLARLLTASASISQAAKAYQRLLKLQPENRDLYLILGNLYQQKGQFETAAETYRAAIKNLSSDSPDLYLLLGVFLQNGGFFRLAKECYFMGFQKPNSYFATVYTQLGWCLKILDEIPEAKAAYEMALSFNSDDVQALSYYRELQLLLCDWSDYESSINWASKQQEADYFATKKNGLPASLVLSLLPAKMSAHKAAAQQRANAIIQNMAEVKKRCNFHYPIATQEKIRIGYISPDFRQHPVGILTHQIFQHHNKDDFEIYAYSTVAQKDGFTRTIQAGCQVFRNISDLSAEAAARQIHADGIHILIDLAGYTAHSRPEILALKPAPIQCSYLGYPDTMGADFIDYFLADNWLVTSEIEREFTEEIIKLPHYFCGSALEISEQKFARQQCGLPADGTVFCCFNTHYKINPEVFRVWMEILQQVPGSVLWLSEPKSPITSENLRREAAEFGINSNRLVFAKKLPLPDYLARYSLADLFLDTFVYNAGSTGVMALWAGVPMVTKIGETVASRMGASICAAAGLESLICQTGEEYRDKAIYLATHPQELIEIREKLQRDKEHLPLFDRPQFVRSLEVAFRQIWQQYSDGRAKSFSGSLVSLVMTVYNRAKYLKKAIESVAAQTYPHWELIVWDDGSTDDSVAIAERLAAADERIRVYRGPHQGQSLSMVEAPKLAGGPYFGQIDSDDLLAPTALEETVAYLEANPDVGMVYSNSILIDENGKRGKLHPANKIAYSPEGLLVDFMTTFA